MFWVAFFTNGWVLKKHKSWIYLDVFVILLQIFLRSTFKFMFQLRLPTCCFFSGFQVWFVFRNLVYLFNFSYHIKMFSYWELKFFMKATSSSTVNYCCSKNFERHKHYFHMGRDHFTMYVNELIFCRVFEQVHEPTKKSKEIKRKSIQNTSIAIVLLFELFTCEWTTKIFKKFFRKRKPINNNRCFLARQACTCVISYRSVTVLVIKAIMV